MPSKISIFYDLETTGFEPLGQILNYCFIAVDSEWNEVKRLVGLVKVSRLQLPRAGAIEATNTDVFEHEKNATHSENEAALLIRSFLEDCKKRNGGKSPLLIGQNSAGFDLDFLRTTLIRNGVSPYGLFEPRDILFLSRFLYATNATFRSRIPPVIKKDKEKPSLSLQHLAQSLGLLKGDQLHESSFDVELTISLAKLYAVEFNSDIREFDCYGLKNFHGSDAEPVLVSEFKLSVSDPISSSWKMFLRQEGNGAFWVNLEKLKPGDVSRDEALKAVIRYKMQGHLLWVAEEISPPPEIKEIALRAKEIIGHVTADELYGESNCYIEQFIYRIPLQDHPILFKAIASAPALNPKASNDITTLARRFWLENCSEAKREEDIYKDAFRSYCTYRYGGKLLLKNLPEGEEPDKKTYHPTLAELLLEIAELKKEKPEKAGLLDKLELFYYDSEIAKVLGVSR